MKPHLNVVVTIICLCKDEDEIEDKDYHAQVTAITMAYRKMKKFERYVSLTCLIELGKLGMKILKALHSCLKRIRSSCALK